MPPSISRQRSAGSVSNQLSCPLKQEHQPAPAQSSGKQRTIQKGTNPKPTKSKKEVLNPSNLGLQDRSVPSTGKSQNAIQLPRLNAIKTLEEDFKKAFWAVYPQLKTDANAVLEQLKVIEDTLHCMDQLSPGAIRNRQSYSHELQALLKNLEALAPKLQHSLDQAKAKATTKGIPFDTKLEHFINELKMSLPTVEELKAKGYWLD